MTKAGTPKDNLTRIREAYEMGFSATLENKNPPAGFKSKGQVLALYPNGRLCVLTEAGYTESWSAKHESLEITSYLYMGELGGSGEIKEGQKFRVKETGEIWGYKTTLDYSMGFLLEKDDGYQDYFQPIELEPYFN